MKPDISMKEKINILLLGATLETKNMGVNILAEGAVKCILRQWPNAKISILDYGYQPKSYSLNIYGRAIEIPLINLRFSKKFYLKNNVARLLITVILALFCPFAGIREKFLKKNPYISKILDQDLVVAISGGDSFSDIYGIQRLLYVSLPQFLVLALNRNLVLLPQTLGPFKSRLAKFIGRNIITRATRVYSRDRDSIEAIKPLLPERVIRERLRFCYDVGFAVDPSEPKEHGIEEALNLRTYGFQLIGFNVSGLLYRGGYSGSNMFGLKLDYQKAVEEIINFFMRQENTALLLVPHVFGGGSHMESDITACLEVYEKMNEKYKNRFFVAKGHYDHKEIKWVIGQCDFFLGSRMHACIAALSQHIPAVGIAYSRKFKGVFESIGVGDLVADPRQLELDEMLEIIQSAYQKRSETKENLKWKMPEVKKRLDNLFSDIKIVSSGN